ncbi:potassium channel subfamily K member 4-like isoform X3 [Biomphalaria glabrata]|uniref:Potassium channel subfamily K member 4-like isoform X3 n=1 Tax=Biomphalaria glabrata TaxID=6526 RepID=A0A9W2ZT27_BIOGL|nr:potassium channel subfamily K member 4-like isoform X3 [Biomphalaria glabrata]
MRDAVLVMLLLVNAVFVCLGGLIFHLLEYYNEAWAHESLKLEFLKFLGYGRFAPTTWGGRLFCIFYTLTGIPLFASMMAGLGERLEELLNGAQKCGRCIKGHPVLEARLKSITILVLSAVIIVMVPSVMFCFFLRWSFLDAVYYSVITLTTVGFGDLFPVEDKNEMTYLYRFLLSVWIFVGLCWVALVLTEVGTTIQRRIEMAAIKSAELSSIMSKKILKSPVSLRSQTVSPNNFNEEHSASV